MRIHIIWFCIWFELTSIGISYGQGTGKIVFQSGRDGNGEIYIMDADGRNPINLTQHPGPDYDPDILPDGKEIVFITERNERIELYTIQTDGTNLRFILDSGGLDASLREPAWSPDGTQIAFSRWPLFDEDQSGGWDIYLFTLGRSEWTRLTYSSANEWSPSWSPDSMHLLFTSWSPLISSFNAFFSMGRDGSNRMLFVDIASTSKMVYSPDGSMLVFSAFFEEGPPEIALINADGSNLRVLTNHPAFDLEPSWSPDGRRIIFTSNRNGSYEIYTMDLEGSDIVQLTPNQSYSSSPRWISGESATAILGSSWGQIKNRSNTNR
jgi:Tol biopolymer transport system component